MAIRRLSCGSLKSSAGSPSFADTRECPLTWRESCSRAASVGDLKEVKKPLDGHRTSRLNAFGPSGVADASKLKRMEAISRGTPFCVNWTKNPLAAGRWGAFVA
jgi:hypothetical protein